MLLFVRFCVFLIFSLIIALIVHELGHLFLAIITRTKIEEIHIGRGCKILSRKKVHIHIIPISGCVVCKLNNSDKKNALKMIMVAIGGALFNSIMFIICLVLEFGMVSFVLALVNMTMCFCSILPIKGSDIYVVLCECGIIKNEDE